MSEGPFSEVELRSAALNSQRPSYPQIPDFSTLTIGDFSNSQVHKQLAQSTKLVKEWKKQILNLYGPEELKRVSKDTKIDHSAAVSLLGDFRMWLYLKNKEEKRPEPTFEGAQTEFYTNGSVLVGQWLDESRQPPSRSAATTFIRTAGASRKRNADQANVEAKQPQRSERFSN